MTDSRDAAPEQRSAVDTSSARPFAVKASVTSVSGARRQFWLEWFLVLAITALALVVRLYRLHDFPPGLYADEAANGLDVLAILGGQHTVYFPRNNGREPLFFYVQALIVNWLGPTPFALRVAAALLGAATVPAFYWLVRSLVAATQPGRFWRPQWVASWAALFLTFSYWHLALSRIGFRAISLPLVAALAFVFFWRAWRWLAADAPLPWRDLLLCGGLLGLSLYTYTAARFLPLVAAGVLIGGSLFRPHTLTRRRSLSALAIIILSACVVFAPLGFYFVNHLQEFAERASEISLFNPRYAPAGPLPALADSTIKTMLMFVTSPDMNLRHNPARRPLFDLLLVGWLVIGLVLALHNFRKPAALFMLLWFGLLATPAILTAEGLPHSLRSIGMLLPAYLLILTGMMAAAARAPNRMAWLAQWLPLPFLLFSAVTNVHDYFTAWRDLDRFRTAFQLGYTRAGDAIAQQSSPASVWVMPLSPNFDYTESSPAFYTLEFLIGDHAGFGTVTVAENAAPAELYALTRQAPFVNVLNLRGEETLTRGALAFDDTKNLLDFLLRKHGRLVPPEIDIGIPYTAYEVQPGTEYVVAQQPISMTANFDDKVQLVQVDYGGTAQKLGESAAALTAKRAPAGDSLWTVLRWAALAPIDYDLKTSLVLRDQAGHVVGQTDTLLVGDHYPVIRTWAAGERASNYHILSILPGIPPGRYQLYVKVYEEQSGVVYSVRDAGGRAVGTEALVGDFMVTPTQAFTPLAPEQPLADRPHLADDLALLGFDLPRPQVAPGDQLPVTLYWHALAQPRTDYRVHLQLLDATGATIAEATSRPGNGVYPTTMWRADEQLRDWMRLALPPTTPPGVYKLAVSLLDASGVVGQVQLADVTVAGRVRNYSAPELALSTPANFAGKVELLGVMDAATLALAPGKQLEFTLVWQAEATPATPIVRFVQLLGEAGPPIAQQDTTPCNGECPASSWLAGEILTDPVSLALPATLPPGPYRLVVGWYDPATLERLSATDGQGTALADNVVVLPLALEQP